MFVRIDENNYTDYIDPVVNGEVKRCAALPRRVPYGALRCAPRSEVKAMSEGEIKDRARYLQQNKSRINDLLDARGIKALDQDGTNFCWTNGPVNTVRAMLCVNNMEYEDLSPASVACRVNGFVNNGGYGTEAMEFITAKGIVPSRLWPNNAINKKYLTQEAVTAAMDYRVVEWRDLQPRNFLLMCTYLVTGTPVTIGLNWWRHQVTAVAVNPDNLDVLVWNSWGADWGENGYGWLSRGKATPDDQCVAQTITLKPAGQTASGILIGQQPA